MADTYDLLAEIKRLKMEVLVSKSGLPFSYDLLSELTPEELKDSVSYQISPNYSKGLIIQKVYIRFRWSRNYWGVMRIWFLQRVSFAVTCDCIINIYCSGENDNEDEMLDCMNGEDDNGDEDRDEMDDEDRDEMDNNEAGATKFIQLKYFHEVAALQAGFYAKRVKLAQQMRLKAFVFISLGWARVSFHVELLIAIIVLYYLV